MTGHVDELLDALAGERECLAELQRELQPAMIRLLAALGRFFAEGGDSETLAEAEHLRCDFLQCSASVASLLARWEASRGSEEACWVALGAMTSAQTRRFDALASAARSAAESDAEFERLRERTRSLLLVFEEVTA